MLSIFGKRDFNGKIMVSVFDKVSKIFGSPVVIDNAESAIRAFGDMVMNKGTVIGQHPDDFVLYRIGYFDPETGSIYQKFKQDEDVLISGTEALYREEQRRNG